MTDAILTQERLKELLHYNPETGEFVWIVNTKRLRIGSIAGNITGGYLRVAVESKRYLAHRLAWFYVYGFWPNGLIDHINGNKTDNRIKNLRESNHTLNGQNQKKAQTRNKLGILGVSKVKRINNPFIAQIRVDGMKISLGSFPTSEQAHSAYLQAKRKLHKSCTI